MNSKNTEGFRISMYKSPYLDSNMYVVRDSNSAVISDPFESESLLNSLKATKTVVDYVILTHEHYDHISGVNYFRERIPCKVICSEECSKRIVSPTRNLSKYFHSLAENTAYDISTPSNIPLYSCNADHTFERELDITWQHHLIEMVETPGHSKGSICVLIDKHILFSGDSLFKDRPTVTHLIGGSKILFQKITLNFFHSLSPNTKVFPGHYESFTLSERTAYLKKLSLGDR